MRRILAMEASSSRSRTIRRSQRPLALAGARIARRDARAFAGGGAAGVHFASAAKQSVARLRQLQKKMAGKTRPSSYNPIYRDITLRQTSLADLPARSVRSSHSQISSAARTTLACHSSSPTMRARIASNTGPRQYNEVPRRRVPRGRGANPDQFLVGRVEPASAERISGEAKPYAALRSSSAALASIQNRWIEPSSS